jgi:hypothetical protein
MSLHHGTEEGQWYTEKILPRHDSAKYVEHPLYAGVYAYGRRQVDI